MQIIKTIALVASLAFQASPLEATQEKSFPSDLVERLVAHRGAHNNVPNNDLSHLPENSLLSLRQAFDVGLKYVECDIHLTSDQQIVVLHDRTLRRLARYNPELARTLSFETFEKILDIPIQKLSYDDIISQVDIGAYCDDFDPKVCRGTQIPLLEDFLKELEGHPERNLLIELKTGNPDLVPILKSLIELHCRKEQLSINQFIFISFDYRLIKKAKISFPYNKHFLITVEKPIQPQAFPHPMNPEEYTGVYHRIHSVHDLEEVIQLAKKASLSGLCLEYNAQQIDSGFMQLIKDKDLISMVWIYPHDDNADMIMRLLDAEVSLISTNQPEFILNSLSEPIDFLQNSI